MDEHGVYRWAELLTLGMSQSQVRRAVRDGSITPVRRGWYAVNGADPRVVAAVRGGGALSCVSALERHGVWVPPTGTDVHIRGNAPAWQRAGAAYCRHFGRPMPVNHAVDDAYIALRHALRCLDHDGIVVVCDSLLNLSRSPRTRILAPTDIVAAFDGASQGVRACLDRCDGRAQSGTESLARLRLRRLGLTVRVQVYVPGLGHVDLMVGDRLIVEVDSRRHHTGVDNYAEDRRRDRVAARHNLLRVRLTYENVVYGWDETVADILGTVRNGYHRAPRHRPEL